MTNPKMNRWVVVVGTALALLWGIADAQKVNRYVLKMQDGVLTRVREGKAFRFRAIETPGLMRADTKLSDLPATLGKIANVGGNAVCFPLEGLSSDGRTLAPDAVTRLLAMMEQITWRYMGAVCKVLGDRPPDDASVRAAMVRTVAAALKDKEEASELVYWIDAPDAAQLVKLFHAAAPNLVTAAKEGADIQVLTSVDALPKEQAAAGTGSAALLIGAVPPPGKPTVHFLLPAQEESYKRLDAAMADPVEARPWTPDNSVLSEEERKDGWIALFDGKTLNGWTVTGPNKQGFVVKEGMIERADTGAESCRTRDRYGDFMLRLDFRIMKKDANTGLYLRAPRMCRQSKIGMEFQIMGDSGKAPDKDTTGAIYDAVAPLVNAGAKEGEWNSLEITFKGPQLRAVLNGKTVQDINFDSNDELRHRLRKGFIGLQDHGAIADFRNIRIKPL